MARIFRSYINELHKERDIKENRFWVRQAQYQRRFMIMLAGSVPLS
jgi:hypothetical protein